MLSGPRQAAQVIRLGICLLGAGMVGWEEPASAQDANTPIRQGQSIAELCRNGVVVPEPQDHPGLVADCAALLGALSQWDAPGLNWSQESPIRQWEGVHLSEVAKVTLLSTSSELRVTHLRLGYPYNLDVLPPEIGRLSRLEHLEFSVSKLKTIPPEIGQLVQLKHLALQNNNLEVLPPDIGQLSRLEYLALFANELKAIPSEIGQLTQLETLYLSGNELGAIPSEIGQLTQLETLYLSGNELEVLPPEIGQLSKLEDLALSGNALETIPSELSQLGNLRKLHIGSCRLRGGILPDLGNLDHLRWLDLADNFLSGAIPPELGQLASLEILNLSENDLTGQIPPDLGRMTALETLYLSGNDLSGPIPPELGQLASLGTLNLSENDLTGQIPLDLGRMAALRVLNLSGNDLSGPIPAELGQLAWLRILNLSHNRLSGHLPAELAQLERLVSLDLSHNRLSGPLGRGLVDRFRQNPVLVDFTGNGIICVEGSPFAFGDVPPCEPPPPPKGRIYWTDLASGDIQRADLDGSNLEIVIDGGGSPEGIALDTSAGKMYWTKWNGAAGKIQRSDLDGSNPETIVITGGEHPRGIALDLDAGKVYYTANTRYFEREFGESWHGGVKRANLDGSSPEELLWEDWRMDPVAAIALDLSAGTMFYSDGWSICRANLDGTGDGCFPSLRLDRDMNPVDIVLDVPRDRIYWSDSQAIHRADLDGSNRETLVTFDSQSVPRSLVVDLKGGRMYWTDSHVIYRADLDGSNAEPLFTGAVNPGGIAFDPIGNRMYWTEPGAGRIQRGDLEGKSVELLIEEVRRAPVIMALDPAGRRMYWTDGATNRIHRADLDGTNVENLAGGLTAPGAIALDVPGGKTYWTNQDTSVIHRADLDGGNVESIVIPGDPDGIAGLALDSTAGWMYWMDWGWEYREPDTVMTYRIGRVELAGTNAEVLSQYSFNTHRYVLRGRVGGLALDPVGGRIYWVGWTSILWSSREHPDVVGSLHRSDLDGRETERMPMWSAFAVDGAIAVDGVGNRLYWSKEGSIHLSDLQGNEATLIAGLGAVGSIALDVSRSETMVATLPSETDLPALSGLAPNYPNPFNAGTRLVYRLADPGPVRLDIFNVLGQRVRTLVDEFQNAGSYQVHWDAHDQGGTRAGAGVYLTRLQYPGGEQTRRLLLLK